MTLLIYHMCPAEAWAEAIAAGRYTGTQDDRRDGFIHFSTAAQIAESARRHRAGQAGLVLVAVEAARLGAPAAPGGGVFFFFPPPPPRGGGGGGGGGGRLPQNSARRD